MSEGELQSPTAPGPRLSQAERSARTERRLLRAALKLVSERGFDRTSLAAIGAEAGYSRGLVNHCFGSKAALLTALVDWVTRRWRDESIDPASANLIGVEGLWSVVDAVRAETHRAPAEMRAFYLLLFEALGPVPELQPRFAELHQELRDRARRLIEAGVEAGQIRSDIDPDAQAGLFIGAFRGIGYQWLLDPSGVDIDALFEELKRTLRLTLCVEE